MKKNVYKFISAGLEICIIVFVFFLIGFKIDEKLQTKYYTILCSFLGIIFALFALFKKVKKG